MNYELGIMNALESLSSYQFLSWKRIMPYDLLEE